MRISDWSSDVCSSDLQRRPRPVAVAGQPARPDRTAQRRGEGLGDGDQSVDGRMDVVVVPAERGAERVGGVRHQIGRASCRERVCPYVYISVVAVSLKKQQHLHTSNTLTPYN